MKAQFLPFWLKRPPVRYSLVSACLILVAGGCIFSKDILGALIMNGTKKIEGERISYQHKYGYIDKNGKVIIEVSAYDAIGSFSEGLAPVWLSKTGWGFINKTGECPIAPQFQKVTGFSEGLAGIKVQGLWGYIDKAGKVVIEPQYEDINPFSEGLAVVVRGNSQHPYQPSLPGQRRTMQAVTRRYVFGATSELVDARQAEKEVLVIDKTGQIILAKHLDEAIQIKHEDARFSEGVIEAFDKKTGLYGFVDKTCKFVIQPKYEQVGRFSEGLARVAILQEGEEKLGFIDRTERFVIPAQFNTDADFRNSTDFSEGLAALTEGLRPTVTEREKFAYINRDGGIALLTDFEEAYPFREGLALVSDEEDKWGFIDKSGRIVITPQFVFAREFSEGLAAVSLAP